MTTPFPSTSLGSRPLRRHSPSAKALGQHFLQDGDVVDQIVEAGGLLPDDVVVEIGPGRGILTSKLVERVGQVVAVELDQRLADTLPSVLGHPHNLQVVCEDARTCDYNQLIPPGVQWKVMANLPYYAANPIVRRLLEEEPRPALLVVMVQQEVGLSMVAGPGKMSILSLAVQFYGRPRLVCSVPPTAFRPQPKVDSAVVSIDVKPQPLLPAGDAPGFFRLAKAAFSAPRKQLHNALSRGWNISPPEANRILELAELNSIRRPGTLTLDEWVRLYRAAAKA